MRIGPKKLIQLIETETGQDNIVVIIDEKEGAEIEIREVEFHKMLDFMNSVEPFMRHI